MSLVSLKKDIIKVRSTFKVSLGSPRSADGSLTIKSLRSSGVSVSSFFFLLLMDILYLMFFRENLRFEPLDVIYH